MNRLPLTDQYRLVYEHIFCKSNLGNLFLAFCLRKRKSVLKRQTICRKIIHIYCAAEYGISIRPGPVTAYFRIIIGRFTVILFPACNNPARTKAVFFHPQCDILIRKRRVIFRRTCVNILIRHRIYYFIRVLIKIRFSCLYRYRQKY